MCLQWAKPIQWSMWHHLDTPTYYTGNICLMGDSAHCSTPHQAANAGQALEDAAVLSHVLGMVKSADQLTKAFEVFDGIRRPRAQEVVRTSSECGKVYTFMDEECQGDREKLVANLRKRWEWIWTHDLVVDLRLAEEKFSSL